jgi:hypothetical protein
VTQFRIYLNNTSGDSSKIEPKNPTRKKYDWKIWIFELLFNYEKAIKIIVNICSNLTACTNNMPCQSESWFDWITNNMKKYWIILFKNNFCK